MSHQLRGDTALIVGRNSLSRVWYFNLSAVEREFVAVVALNLHHHVYEARERIMPDALTVIASGLCARRLLVMTRGAVLGVDVVIKDKHWGLRDLDPAHCLTFAQTASIDRETIFSIVAAHFPIARAHLTYAAAVLTIRSAFRRAYAFWLKHKRFLRRAAAQGLIDKHGRTESEARAHSRGKRAAVIACKCVSSLNAGAASRRKHRMERWLERAGNDRVSAGWDAGMALTQASRRAKGSLGPPVPSYEPKAMRMSGSGAMGGGGGGGGGGGRDSTGGGGGGGAAFNARLCALEAAMGQLMANVARADKAHQTRLELMDDKLDAVFKAVAETTRWKRHRYEELQAVSCSTDMGAYPLTRECSACLSAAVKERPATRRATHRANGKGSALAVGGLLRNVSRGVTSRRMREAAAAAGSGSGGGGGDGCGGPVLLPSASGGHHPCLTTGTCSSASSTRAGEGCAASAEAALPTTQLPRVVHTRTPKMNISCSPRLPPSGSGIGEGYDLGSARPLPPARPLHGQRQATNAAAEEAGLCSGCAYTCPSSISEEGSQRMPMAYREDASTRTGTALHPGPAPQQREAVLGTSVEA